MAESQIPEWSTEYLPYGKMKTMLKELVARVSAAEQAAAADDANDLDALEAGVNDINASLKARRNSLDEQIDGEATLTGTLAARTRGELLALRRKGTEGSSGENLDATETQTNDDTDDTLVATVIDPENTALLSQAAAGEESRFFTALDDSLRRVVAFYGDRATRCKRDAVSHASQLKHLKRAARRATRDLREAELHAHERARGIEHAMRRVGSAGAIARELISGKKKDISTTDVSLQDSSQQDTTKPNIKQRKIKSVQDAKALVLKTAGDARLLRRAVAESYRGANMLESYVSLNVEAFRKIVKKHDKLTGWQTQETYMKGLRELRVFHDDEIGNLRVKMEHFYLKIEETLCELEPERWDRRFGEKGRLGISEESHHGLEPDSKKKLDKKEKSGGKNLGFYEIRRRRNRVLAELRKDGRAGVVAAGGKRPGGPSFVAGIVVGCALGLLFLLISRITESCEVGSVSSGYFSRASCAAVTQITPAVRFPLLVATHVVGYGGLVRAWGETKVNAGFIFQAKRGTELPATGAALSGALAMSIWIMFSIGLTQIAKVEENEDEATNAEYSTLTRTHVTAGLAFLGFVLLFVVPLPRSWKKTQKLCQKYELRYPPDSTRRFFLRALFDGMCAPFTRVKMMDFFLMDQIVSQTTALRDGVLVMCLLVGFTEDASRKHAPLIALAPFWLRFLQTVRRFRDDGHKVHLVNAGKYFSALVAVSFGLRVWYAQREVVEWSDDFLEFSSSANATEVNSWIVSNPEPSGATYEMRATFTVFQALATVYGATWDFFMDWSVVSLVKTRKNENEKEDVLTGAEGGVRRTNILTRLQTVKPVAVITLPSGYKLRWLERRTMMKERWKYATAVALNLALRHFWITAAVPNVREGISLGAEAWVTVVALVEVFRRSVWSYFRVENEHATNCGMFRATLEVPLPFQDGELTDDEDEIGLNAGGGVSRAIVTSDEIPINTFAKLITSPMKRESPRAEPPLATVDDVVLKDTTTGNTSDADKRRGSPDDTHPQIAVSEDEEHSEDFDTFGHSDHSDHSTGSNGDGSSDDDPSNRRVSRRFSLVHSDVEDFDSDDVRRNEMGEMDPTAVSLEDVDQIRLAQRKPRRSGSRLTTQKSVSQTSPPRTRRSSFTFETSVTVPTPPVSAAALSTAPTLSSPTQQRRSRGLEAIAKLVESQHKDLHLMAGEDEGDEDETLDESETNKADE